MAYGGQRDVGNAPHPEDYVFDDALVSMEGLGERILEPGGSGLGNRSLGRPQDIRDVPKHDMTEVWVDRTIAFAKEHRDRPFYIHLWPRDVHDPFKPSEEELARIVPRFSNSGGVDSEGPPRRAQLRCAEARRGSRHNLRRGDDPPSHHC